MSLGMGTRRAALDGIARILDATGLEDLFDGPDDEAIYLHELLTDVSRARASQHYWEICRTARRRGVTPEFVIDRAAVLRASIDERRKSDLYRVFGVEPLANAETIKQRWHDLAKTYHPDVGGDPAIFRRLKDAWEVLRDQERRTEYERFWLRAHGPFERVLPRDDESATLVRTAPAGPRVVMVMKRPGATVPAEVEAPEPRAVVQLRDGQDTVAKIGATVFGGELAGLLATVERAFATVAMGDIVALQRDIDRRITLLEATEQELAQLAALKRRLSV